jgi:hypothetical protein
MAYNPEYELRSFGRWRTERVLSIGGEGTPDAIHGTLLLAIASKETNLRNIVGGGYFEAYVDESTGQEKNRFIVTGEDRGLFQINAKYHHSWLDSVKGCDSGKYDEIYDSAFPPGRVPGLTAGCRKAISLLRYNIAYQIANGVPEADAVRVAVAAYNCGNVPANRAYKEGNVDKYTTLGNYSHIIINERQPAIRKWIKNRGWGSHNPRYLDGP